MLPSPVSFSELVQYSTSATLKEAFLKDIQTYPKNSQFYSLNVDHHLVSSLKTLANETNAPFNFLNIDEIKNHTLSTKKTTVFILPELNFTIFNINYDRLLDKEISAPYLVAIKNRQKILCAKQLQDFHFSQAGEAFALLPHIARFYLESNELLNWIVQKRIPTPHSDIFEKNFFNHYCTPIDNKGISSESLHTFYKLFSTEKKILFDHYPLHLFYKKYFNRAVELNLVEQGLYGF